MQILSVALSHSYFSRIQSLVQALVILSPVEFLNVPQLHEVGSLEAEQCVCLCVCLCVATTTQGQGNILPNFDSKSSVQVNLPVAQPRRSAVQDKFAEPMKKEQRGFHMLWSLHHAQHTSGTFHLLYITELHEDRRLTAGSCWVY